VREFDITALSTPDTPSLLKALQESHGVAQIALPADLECLSLHIYDRSHAFFELDEEHPQKKENMIDKEKGLTGYHGVNGLGGNNRYRKGFILEKNDTLKVDFAEALSEWRTRIHELASLVLRRLASELSLPLNTFETGGLWGNVCTNGQMHLKTYSDDASGDDALSVRLSPHKDPSVVTLLIHDGPARHGLQGLQVEVDHEWKDIDGRSGPGVATLLVGQLLALAVGDSAVEAPRHRVALPLSSLEIPRTVSTFFFQPHPEQTMRSLRADDLGKKSNSKGDVNYGTFAEWKARQYGAYFKKGRKGQPGGLMGKRMY